MKLFDKDWWKQQLHKEHIIELNELEINNPNKPKVGETYDVKVWWAGDYWEINSYLRNIYEPADGTVGGAEGWYWSKGWKCVSIPISGIENKKVGAKIQIGFESPESGERFPYNNEKIRKSTINELQISKPKKYIPIVKPTKPEYINSIENFVKLSHYIENTNLKLQKEIGRLNDLHVSEKGSVIFPLTIDKASKIIFSRWFFENLPNFYESRHIDIVNKWWDESRICLEDLEKKDINELNVNNPIDDLILNHKNQGSQGEPLFTDCRWDNNDGPMLGYPYKKVGDEKYWWNSDNGKHYNSKEALNILNNIDNYLKKPYLYELEINNPKQELLKKLLEHPKFDYYLVWAGSWKTGLETDKGETITKDSPNCIWNDHLRISQTPQEAFKWLNTLNELEINKPFRQWDFTKYIPNFNPNDIKIGDKIKIRTINLYTFTPTGKVIIFDVDRIEKYELEDGGLFFTNNEMGYDASGLIDINNNNKKKNLRESKQSIKDSFVEFIKFLQQELPIKEKYNIKLTKDKSKTTSFAHFDPNNNEIVVYIKGRNLMDSFRSLAHEWRHLYQNINNELTNTSGEDGSSHENEANAFAGLVMRKWGKLHPGYYTQLVENKVNELSVNNPNLNAKEVHNYYIDNLHNLNLEEYIKICKPYCEKYDVLMYIGYRTEFELLSQQDLNKLYKEMRQLVHKYTNNKLNESKNDEIFSAYHGRYKFDVSKAYDLIKQGNIKTKIKTYSPEVMHFLSHPEFSEANPEKYNNIQIDYNEPLGLIANFKDENDKNELILIDGNHRTRKAVEEKQPGQYIVMYDPNDVNKILTINNEIPKKLFSDDE